VKIVILVEGRTEVAFKESLIKFLRLRLSGQMPRVKFSPCHGHIDTGEKLRRKVDHLLQEADAVIALTDVYTGGNPFKPGELDFRNAQDAKDKMRKWVGPNERFYPHAAQHDFEAWLLPFWPSIQKLAKHTQNPPPGAPESVNHTSPPSYRIKAIFEAGQSRDSYSKERDAKRILKENDLLIAARACPELKAFLNTILTLCQGEAIP
jgi:hypothetical protein